MLDEPQTFSAGQREHAQSCRACSANFAAIRADAAFARASLAGEPRVDMAAAYDRIQARVSRSTRIRQFYGPMGALAAAALLVVALVFTPLGGAARSFLTVFEPKQFQPVEITRADMRTLHLLPQADDVGTQHVVRKPRKQVYDSFESAQSHAGFALLKPTALPSGFGTVRSYFGYAPGEMTFTFSAAKARAFERRSHKPLPPMPPSLDGTTVRLQTGSVFNAHYEATPVDPHASPKPARDTTYFELVEAQAPRVTSSGASLDTLERYLLSLPNVTPDLAREIRALGNIQNTVPVPVVIDKQTARRVTVNGAPGLAIGDNTGLGAGVMWQKNGIVYVVAGPLRMDDVLAVANGLR
jgi:hypothetical protein